MEIIYIIIVLVFLTLIKVFSKSRKKTANRKYSVKSIRLFDLESDPINDRVEIFIRNRDDC
jgi:hypothetical protein